MFAKGFQTHAFLSVVILCCSIVEPSRCSAEGAPEVERVFDRKYAEWRERLRQMPPTLTLSATVEMDALYGYEEFEDIVALGVAGVPYILEKLREDNTLDYALQRITKWKYHAKRTQLGPGQYYYTIEEFPDLRYENSHPDSTELWLRWWREGRSRTRERFAALLAQWKVLRHQAKQKEAEKKYERIKDLGIPVLPYLIDHIQKSERDLLPVVRYLTEGELPESADVEKCMNWWKHSKSHWTLPPPEVSERPQDNKRLDRMQ